MKKDALSHDTPHGLDVAPSVNRHGSSSNGRQASLMAATRGIRRIGNSIPGMAVAVFTSATRWPPFRSADTSVTFVEFRRQRQPARVQWLGVQYFPLFRPITALV